MTSASDNGTGTDPGRRKPLPPASAASAEAVEAGVRLAHLFFLVALEQEGGETLGPWRLGELARGATAANSAAIANGMVDVIGGRIPRREGEILRDLLIRDIRTGETGTNFTATVLSAEIAGMPELPVAGLATVASLGALGDTHKTFQDVLTETNRPLLASGERDRRRLIAATADAIAAVTPQIMEAIGTAFAGAGLTDADATSRCANVRDRLLSSATHEMAVDNLLWHIGDIEDPIPPEPSL